MVINILIFAYFRYHCCSGRYSCPWSNRSHHSFSAFDEEYEKAKIMLSVLLNIQAISLSTSPNETCETPMTLFP